MAEKQTIYALPSGTVVCRTSLNALLLDQLSDRLSQLVADQPKALMVVANAEIFFTADNLITMIANKDGRYRLVNEKIKFFTEDQIKALMGANGEVVKAADFQGLNDAPEVPVVPDDGGVVVGKKPAAVNGYHFVQVPAGWSISGDCSLGATKIKRKRNNGDGDTTNSWVSTKDYPKLWAFASSVWAGYKAIGSTISVTTGAGLVTAKVYANYVLIGGNIVRRYEMEQIAKYRGWAFPEMAVKAA